MNEALLALPVRVFDVRNGHADEEEDEAGDEGEVLQREEVALLLEQLKLLRATCDGLSTKVNDALRHAQSATVELHGVAGNPGLSQQLFALRERSDVTLAALQRELEASRNHAAQMLQVTLDSQDRAAESLRHEIRALENGIRAGRDAVDDRIRDIDAEMRIQIHESEERTAKLTHDAREETDTHSRVRTWSIAVACTGVTLWSLAASYRAIFGDG